MELCIRTEIKNLDDGSDSANLNYTVNFRLKLQNSWSLSQTQNPSTIQRKLIPDTVISYSQMLQSLKSALLDGSLNFEL